MARGQADNLLRHLRGRAAADDSSLRDRDLLERFVTARDDAAFEALVQRHGPMVLRVCQGVLRERQAAEDACQATFLVLLRKAHAIRKQRSVASWLYKVAYRIALRARGQAVRRHERESLALPGPTADALDDVTWRELRALLDEELQRLAEKYRAPVILCCLEGRTRDEAAQHLGWSLNRLKSRLERGRELLRGRLTRRGVTLSAALAATLLAENTTTAAVPAALAETIVRSAVLISSGRMAPAAALSANVNTLVKGAVSAMAFTKLKITVACLLAVAIIAVGAGTVAHQLLAARRPTSPIRTDGPADPQRAAVPAGDRVVRTDRYGDPLPAGAVARLGTYRFRHMHTLSSAAYSGDGKKLVSGSWDSTVRVWDADTGRELQRFRDALQGVSSVAISPDGTVAAGGDMNRTLVLWDTTTGQVLRRAERLDNTVFGLRFAADGRTLAGLSGNVVRVWDVATLAVRHRLTLPRDDPRPFTISADFRTVVTAGPDHSLAFWDIASGKRRGEFPSGQIDVAQLALSGDGKLLASGGGQADRTVHVWDSATGKEVWHFARLAGWVGSLAFSPDDRTLAAGDQVGTLHFYDLTSGKERARARLRNGSWVRGLAFSPDGKRLAAGGTDERAIRFFDVATGRELRTDDGHENEVMTAAVSADGKTLVSADRNGVVCWWDLTTGKQRRRWESARAEGVALAVAPDGRTFALAGGDRAVHLRAAATGNELRSFHGHQGAINAVVFSPDGRTLASGGWEDHTIRLWDVAEGKELLRIKLPMPNGHNYGDVPLLFSADGQLLFSGSADRMNPTLYFWDVSTGQEVRRIGHVASHLALSADGRTLASVGWDRRIRLWEVASGKEMAGIAAEAGALAFSPGGQMLAYGGTDGVVHLWEVASRQERCRFAGHQSGGDKRGTFASGVAVLAFTPDGRTLISGGGDTTLLLWDVWESSAKPRSSTALEHLWTDLASSDAPRAYQALCALVAAGEPAVSFLQDRLHAATACDAQQLSRLIGDLASNQFVVRDRATDELLHLNESAVPPLRQALRGRISEEARRRIQQVLEHLEGPPTAERLRDLRATEALERVHTPEARQLLRALARGAPEARLTRAAREALQRLATGTPEG